MQSNDEIMKSIETSLDKARLHGDRAIDHYRRAGELTAEARRILGGEDDIEERRRHA